MMTDEQQLLLVRGTIASLPHEKQAKVREMARRILLIVEEDEDVALLAVSLICAEQSVQS